MIRPYNLTLRWKRFLETTYGPHFAQEPSYEARTLTFLFFLFTLEVPANKEIFSPMLSDSLRKKFLHYFEKKGHRVFPSAPVIPFQDPSLLFINAGMNPFKDIFLGKELPKTKRAASSQKCIRAGGKHNDLENVGHTSRHLTFFEMLGNFSFGDYFKKEAIAYAWEVATEILEIEVEKIWVTVFEKDEESLELWKPFLPFSRIVKMGEKDNFWSMGDIGPCGPCSELLFDRGEKFSSAKNPLEDEKGERFFEFWNLVFMENQKQASGELIELPSKSIDTGVGLERLALLKMGVDNVFETDILQALIQAIVKVTRIPFSSEKKSCFYVIADHIRSLSFAIADGACPSNLDRGYVLRKILRRAVRYGRQLGLKAPFLSDLVTPLVNLMGEAYPEIKQSSNRIEEILYQEEESFLKTLQKGGDILQSILESSKKEGFLSGKDAFKLKDTYGLPLEEIRLMAHDYQLKVDTKEFEHLEKKARELSQKAHWKKREHICQGLSFSEIPPTVFTGYQEKEEFSPIGGILKEGKWVLSLEEGEEGVLFLEKTPFYAEMGGQVGDTGHITKKQAGFLVEDTKAFSKNWIGHVGRVEKGSFCVQDSVKALFDYSRRIKIQNNHTATHLLHWALQKVLGEHIKQAGSLVEEKRFRFDFSHHKTISTLELFKIELLIQEKICENLAVSTYEIPYKQAQKDPHIKQFFGDKYEERVRVVDMFFSKELCGGTHTSFTGTIGTVKVVKESSIAAGTRRIEAVTAVEAQNFIQEREKLLYRIAEQLKTPPSKLELKIFSLIEEKEGLEKQVKKSLQSLQKELAKKLQEKVFSQKGFSLICEEVDFPPSELMALSEEASKGLSPSVIILGSKKDLSCLIVARISQALSCFDARELLQKIAPLIQGGAGGKKTFAQAGGKKGENLSTALSKLKQDLEDPSFKK